MPKQAVHDLTTEELHAQLNDAREELMKLRFQQVTGQLTDTSRMRVVRRDIARIQTILTARSLAAEQEGKA